MSPEATAAAIASLVRQLPHTGRPIVIALEGNLGTGKSTVLSILNENGFYTAPEPVHNMWLTPLRNFYGEHTVFRIRTPSTSHSSYNCTLSCISLA